MNVRTKILKSCFFIIFIAQFASCELFIANSQKDVFLDADRPEFVQNVAGDYFLCEPWNYNKDYNAGRSYPLFIYLHGSGSDGAPGILPCFNNDNDKKMYPCFVYLPHNYNNATLIEQVESIRTTYRIDPNRIYVMGYSMGGSGSFSFVNAYYDDKKQIVAGIVRMAGQSQTELRTAITEKCSVWYHLGLMDTPERVNIGYATYDFFKNHEYYKQAIETVDFITIPNNQGTTKTLTVKSKEKIKLSTYDNAGHGISNMPLQDPYVLKWLFQQNLIQ